MFPGWPTTSWPAARAVAWSSTYAPDRGVSADGDLADGDLGDRDLGDGDLGDGGPDAAGGGGLTIGQAEFRTVLGHFASGVVIVTGHTPAGPSGFTCQA